MQKSTTVRVSQATRDGLRSLAVRDGLTLDEAIARLVKAERQRRIGEALAMYEPTADNAAWLDLGARTVLDESG